MLSSLQTPLPTAQRIRKSDCPTVRYTLALAVGEWACASVMGMVEDYGSEREIEAEVKRKSEAQAEANLPQRRLLDRSSRRRSLGSRFLAGRRTAWSKCGNGASGQRSMSGSQASPPATWAASTSDRVQVVRVGCTATGTSRPARTGASTPASVCPSGSTRRWQPEGVQGREVRSALAGRRRLGGRALSATAGRGLI